MIEFKTLAIELSPQMKQRIASGEVAFDEATVLNNTIKFVRQLCGGVKDRTIWLDEIRDAMKEGSVDPHAHCSFSNGFFPESDPLLIAAIHHTRPTHDRVHEDLIAWLVEQNSCYLPDAKGVPAVHMAYVGAYGRNVKDKRFWFGMRAKPEFELEKSYYFLHDALQANGAVPAMPAYGCMGTMLEHECIRAQRWERYLKGFPNTEQFREDAISDDLMKLGAVVPPEHMNRVMDHEHLREYWESAHQQLMKAIAQKDGEQVREWLAHGCAATSFALGHGRQMCRKEFWGEFWTQGRAAMLSLPEWVKHRLVHDMMAMVQDEMPEPVVQGWSHELFAPKEKVR